MNLQLENPQVLRLSSRIKAQVSHPINRYELAALIESMGITDGIARADYGEPDVLSLATRCEPIVRNSQTIPIEDQDRLDDPAPYGYENIFTSGMRKLGLHRAYQWGMRFGEVNLIGFFFAMPMVVSIIGLLVLGASLWAALINQPPVATAIGLGTVASFVVTGGYSQAIGRRGLFYRLQDEHALTRTVCYYFIGVGFEMVLAVGVVGFLILSLFGILPIYLALVAVTYYFFLSLLWLFLAVLYMLGQPLLFTPAIVIGIIVVYALQHYGLSLVVRQSLSMILAGVLSFLAGYAAFGQRPGRNAGLVWSCIAAMGAMILALVMTKTGHLLPIYGDMLIGISVAALLVFFFVLFLFAQRQAREEAEMHTARLPRSSLLWYKVGPYFAYGLLYYLFLFVDRLIAWSAPDRSAVYSGFLIRFRTGYEVGMDWGLILLFITVGLTESQINGFAQRIRNDEQRHIIYQSDQLSNLYKRFYFSRMILFIVVSIVAAIVLWFGVLAIANHASANQPAVRAYLQPIPKYVFLVSTPGYAFLSWALFNNVFLFCLSRPERVLPGVAIALVVDIVVGYVLTRLGTHELASWGFTFGSLALAIYSTGSVIRVLDHLDYYYYSAFL